MMSYKSVVHMYMVPWMHSCLKRMVSKSITCMWTVCNQSDHALLHDTIKGQGYLRQGGSNMLALNRRAGVVTK